MAKSKRPHSVEDLSKLVADLIDHIKVLVSAVDDLRCEVEWWARNAADERSANESAARCRQRCAGDSGQSECEPASEVAPVAASSIATGLSLIAPAYATAGTATSLPTRPLAYAAEGLAKRERQLAVGRPGAWPEDWEGEEPPELPTGEVIRVDEETWSAVLDFRPAHVVDMGCCCEDGIGAPYLLAWQNGDGCFLRELTEEEAIELQTACLAAQSEAQALHESSHVEPMQLGLWQD